MARLSVIEQLIKHRMPDRPVQAPSPPSGGTETITDLQSFLKKQEELVTSFQQRPESTPVETTTTPVPSIADQIRAQQQIAENLTTGLVEPPIPVSRVTIPQTPVSELVSFSMDYSTFAPPVVDRALAEAPIQNLSQGQDVVREVSPPPARISLFGGQVVL